MASASVPYGKMVSRRGPYDKTLYTWNMKRGKELCRDI